MKVICDGLDLADAASKVAKALPQKSINPVLEGIKLTAKGDTLTLFATDMDISIKKIIKAEVLVEGELIVQGKIFCDYIRRLNDEQIQLVCTDEKTLNIKYTDSQGSMQCLNIDDYPFYEEEKFTSSFNIAEDELKDAINKVIIAVSTDDNRPVLKGVLFEIESYTLVAVALDGYRLALSKKPLEKESENKKIIVPARTLIELSKLLDENEKVITAKLGNKIISIDLGHTVLTSRLIMGEFINYKQIINVEPKTVMTINKAQFQKALDRASIFTSTNNLVKLDIKEGLLTITSNSEINAINEKIAISIKGVDLAIAFNCRFLNDCLRVTDNEFIKMSFTNSTTPAIITPCDSDDLLFLVLPIRMTSNF